MNTFMLYYIQLSEAYDLKPILLSFRTPPYIYFCVYVKYQHKNFIVYWGMY